MAKQKEATRISADDLIKSTKDRKVIPCCLSMDIGLGGGVPYGGTVVVAGRPKVGKTTIVLSLAANAQNLYGSKVFYFNIEGRLSNLTLQQVPNLKTDIENFEVVMPPVIMGKDKKIAGYEKWHAGQWWDEIGKTITENPGCFVIVDSLASLSPDKEVSEASGYQDRGRRNQFITQVQANTSGYGPVLQAKVGNSIKHQADVSIFSKTVTPWAPDASGKINGQDVVFKVECSAMGPPFIEFIVPLRFGYGVDTVKDTIEHGINWDLINKAASWVTVPFNESGEFIDISTDKGKERLEECIKIQGLEKVVQWFFTRPKEVKLLYSKISEKLMV